jgi:hypothetical protein
LVQLLIATFSLIIVTTIALTVYDALIGRTDDDFAAGPAAAAPTAAHAGPAPQFMFKGTFRTPYTQL